MMERQKMEPGPPGAGQAETDPPIALRKIRLFGREFTLPRSRLGRIAIGVNLVFFGMLGFLPILGFWMIPLGLLLLSFDIAVIRRIRRRMIVYYGGLRNGKRKPRR